MPCCSVMNGWTSLAKQRRGVSAMAASNRNVTPINLFWTFSLGLFIVLSVYCWKFVGVSHNLLDFEKAQTLDCTSCGFHIVFYVIIELSWSLFSHSFLLYTTGDTFRLQRLWHLLNTILKHFVTALLFELLKFYFKIY